MVSFRIGLACLFVILCIIAPAHATLQQIDMVDITDEQPDTYFRVYTPGLFLTVLPAARFNDMDWGWTHTFNVPGEVFEISSATIDIEAYDVDIYEISKVYIGDVEVGELTGETLEWSNTVLNIPTEAFETLASGEIKIWFDIGQQKVYDFVTLQSSTMAINYNIIPEPLTGLFLGLGALFVGYRHRRTSKLKS